MGLHYVSEGFNVGGKPGLRFSASMAPSLRVGSVQSVNELSEDNDAVAIAFVASPEFGQSYVFALVNDASGTFVIDADTGEITVALASRLDPLINIFIVEVSATGLDNLFVMIPRASVYPDWSIDFVADNPAYRPHTMWAVPAGTVADDQGTVHATAENEFAIKWAKRIHNRLPNTGLTTAWTQSDGAASWETDGTIGTYLDSPAMIHNGFYNTASVPIVASVEHYSSFMLRAPAQTGTLRVSDWSGAPGAGEYQVDLSLVSATEFERIHENHPAVTVIDPHVVAGGLGGLWIRSTGPAVDVHIGQPMLERKRTSQVTPSTFVSVGEGVAPWGVDGVAYEGLNAAVGMDVSAGTLGPTIGAGSGSTWIVEDSDGNFHTSAPWPDIVKRIRRWDRILSAAEISAYEAQPALIPASPAFDQSGIFPTGYQPAAAGYSPYHEEDANTAADTDGFSAVEFCRRSGFNVAGPWYTSFGHSRDGWDVAIEQGMAIVAMVYGVDKLYEAGTMSDPIPTAIDKETHETVLAPGNLPDAEIDSDMAARMLEYTSDNVLDTAVAYFAGLPEELRTWRTQEMRYLSRAFPEIAANDPKSRPVYMYEPNHRTTAELEITQASQSMIVMGMYVTPYGLVDDRALQMNWAWDQILATTHTDHPMMQALSLYIDSPGYTEADIAATPAKAEELSRLLRHDVFLGLCRGAQGWQIWSLFHYRGAVLTTYLRQVQAYGAAIKEAMKFHEAWLHGTPGSSLSPTVTSGPATIFSVTGNATSVEGDFAVGTDPWPSVRVQDWADANGRRVIVAVNSAESSITADVSGFSADAVIVESGGGSAWSGTGTTRQLALGPFEAVVAVAGSTDPIRVLELSPGRTLELSAGRVLALG